jgi:YidC/Oxa1 family membrane protein insertase
MFKFMPYMMILFCYSFGSGLALYWTVSNIFTVVQQLIINRMPEHAVAPPAPGGMKNVTPAAAKPKKK